MSERLKFTPSGEKVSKTEGADFRPVTGEHLEMYSSLTKKGKEEIQRNWEIQS